MMHMSWAQKVHMEIQNHLTWVVFMIFTIIRRQPTSQEVEKTEYEPKLGSRYVYNALFVADQMQITKYFHIWNKQNKN